MSDRVSVIICTYNYGRFVQPCLDSVFSQSRPADEVVVVDDGSTDETPEVVSRFPSVRYVYQENAGKATAFSRGFALASGDIVCHLDADDYWLPNKLERSLQILEQTSAGAVVHDAFYVDGLGSPLYGSKMDIGGERQHTLLSFPEVLLACFIYPPWNIERRGLGAINSICVRRQAVSDCFPLPVGLGLAVDGALLLGAARHGLIFSPEKLSAYRHHDSNYFVRDVSTRRVQRRLFHWAGQLTGVEAKYDKRILQALAIEASVHAALAMDDEVMNSATAAASLLPKLFRLRLMPNWKHFALPVACLLRWRKIRNMLSKIHRARESRRRPSPRVVAG